MVRAHSQLGGLLVDLWVNGAATENLGVPIGRFMQPALQVMAGQKERPTKRRAESISGGDMEETH
ncbi:hypothetical protein BN2475_630030 [Paraburkholderia ribeironis]|uniref:Uncharacterized protein n=1 Tax=Paraburkholderia ribeironis TaxID=1247936 RepID=A0A1N7SFK3_9BURK|nr:hypothetical protein BN2475_630030 [Paraburkholderia ribeironis]